MAIRNPIVGVAPGSLLVLIAGCVLVGLGLWTSGCSGSERAADPPVSRPGRIILLSMDTVRADRVSGYGSATTTPNLAKIAAEGAVFRDFFAASTYTLPSHMSIFSGLDVSEHGLVHSAARISGEVKTLAGVLRRAGYLTKGLHGGGWMAGRFGFGRGFDEYEESPGDVVVDSLWTVLRWMRSNRDVPYFLFLHTYRAHHPWGGFERYRRAHPERDLPSAAEIEELRLRYPRSLRRDDRAPPDIPAALRETCTFYNQLSPHLEFHLGCGDRYLPADFLKTPHFEGDRAALVEGYDQRIRLIDMAIGQIRKTLLELSQWEDTLLLVTSDHGEAFFEHGLYRHEYIPFDEVLKVPLIVSFPRLLRDSPTPVVEGLAWHLDLMPTVLNLVGAEYPGRPRGMDLTEVMLGRAVIPADRAIYPAVLKCCGPSPPLRRVVLKDGLKWIEGDRSFGDAWGLLFDLRESPQELRNLRTARPESFASLSDQGEQYERGLERYPPIHQKTGEVLSIEPGSQVTPLELSDAERARLQALGYAN